MKLLMISMDYLKRVSLPNSASYSSPCRRRVVPVSRSSMISLSSFTLVVDDPEIHYSTREGADNLIKNLKPVYPWKVDLTGKNYLGMTITRVRKYRTFSVSMPGCINKILCRHRSLKLSGYRNCLGGCYGT